MENTRNPTNLLSTDPGNLKREKIRTIPITLIDGANVHPFQVREDDEELLCTFAHVCGDDLSDGLSFAADRCEQCAEVMDTAEENTSDEDP